MPAGAQAHQLLANRLANLNGGQSRISGGCPFPQDGFNEVRVAVEVEPPGRIANRDTAELKQRVRRKRIAVQRHQRCYDTCVQVYSFHAHDNAFVLAVIPKAHVEAITVSACIRQAIKWVILPHPG